MNSSSTQETSPTANHQLGKDISQPGATEGAGCLMFSNDILSRAMLESGVHPSQIHFPTPDETRTLDRRGRKPAYQRQFGLPYGDESCFCEGDATPPLGEPLIQETRQQHPRHQRQFSVPYAEDVAEPEG